MLFAYYLFTFQQYLIHNVQHNYKQFKTHRLKHHTTYDSKEITKQVKHNSVIDNLDLYFYGNIFCIIINSKIFYFHDIIFQLVIAYLSYYFHSEYHNPKSIWNEYRFFKYLSHKHKLHHQFPNRNYFLLDPTFDIVFGTFRLN